MCQQQCVPVPFLFLVVWSLLGMASAACRAADPSDQPRDGHVFIISNVHSGKALGVEKGSKEANAGLIQDDSAETRVHWRLEKVDKGHFRIINTKSKMSVDVPMEAKEAGVRIIQWNTTIDAPNQHWEFVKHDDFYVIQSKDSGLALSVDNRSKDDGAAIKQMPLKGKKGETDHSQLWKLTEVKKK